MEGGEEINIFEHLPRSSSKDIIGQALDPAFGRGE
jgi:hypothetical protein